MGGGTRSRLNLRDGAHLHERTAAAMIHLREQAGVGLELYDDRGWGRKRRWDRGRPRGGCGGKGPTATSPRRRSHVGGARGTAGAPRLSAARGARVLSLPPWALGAGGSTRYPMDLCRCDVQKGERRGRASRGVGGVSGGLARCGCLVRGGGRALAS